MGRSSSSPQFILPQPDPTLQGTLDAAQRAQTTAIQSGLSQRTQDMVTQFGTNAQAYGANVSAPFTSPAGGFSTPPMTALGALVGMFGGR